MMFTCKRVPLCHGEPMDFIIGGRYEFAQERRVFVLYKPQKGYIRRTDIKIGYYQFRLCFERV